MRVIDQYISQVPVVEPGECVAGYLEACIESEAARADLDDLLYDLYQVHPDERDLIEDWLTRRSV